MKQESFFDLEIATVEPGEAPPPGAHWVRIEDPPPGEVRLRVRDGWFHKPSYVTYLLETPESLEAYIEAQFRSGTRNKPRKLLREVPRRYRIEEGAAERVLDPFVELYRRTVVARPRGRDRVAEHEEGFGKEWLAFQLYAGAALVAGILVHERPDHLSVGYGAFDPAHRELDLEHFLIMRVLARAAERGARHVSLGMDTNRYGHHLPLGLPAYKLRLGFVPWPCEPAGRELLRVQSFAPFEEGLFFYAYEGGWLAGHLFTRGEPDLRPFRHHNAPPIRVHSIPKC